MKKIKSYTSIWSVEKVIYAINDLQLPFLVTFTQMTWFVVSLFLVILFGKLLLLSMIDGALIKYVGIPDGLAWFMSQNTFDGKKLYGFLKSIITYTVKPKVTYARKPVELHNQRLDETITMVRSEMYYDVPN